MRVHEKTGRPIPFYKDVDGFRLPGLFSTEAYLSALSYKPKPDDLFVVTYPKCGTTWVQNIVSCIFRKGKPLTSLMDRLRETPFLEFVGAQVVEQMTRPGSIKVHLPFRLIPYSSDAKYIYIARNPKDCCVSFYYHSLSPHYEFEGTFDDYFELFINGETDFGDYFDHLLSWYEHRNDPNVLFLTYEGLKKDIEGNVMKIAEFMGPQYKKMLEDDPAILSDVIKHSSFAYMKEVRKALYEEMKSLPQELDKLPELPEDVRKSMMNLCQVSQTKSPQELVRKGIVGDWRNHFSEEQNKRLEAKFRERTKGTDIQDLWKDSI